MRSVFSLLLAAIDDGIGSGAGHSRAGGPVYIVSYIDVAPANRATAAGLLRQLANDSRKDEGNVRFEILQRTAPSNQFAIVAIWKDQKAYDAHSSRHTSRSSGKRSSRS